MSFLSWGNTGTITATNVVMGYNAQYPASDATNNVIIGVGAGADVGSGSDNVIIGDAANVSGCSRSIAIGSGAVVKANYSIAIGRGAVSSTPNVCTIGSSVNRLYTGSYGRGFIRQMSNSGVCTITGTVSAAQLLNGVVIFSTDTLDASNNITLPTAAQMVAAIANPEVNMNIVGVMVGYGTKTPYHFIAGTGCTLHCGPNIGITDQGQYVIALTNVTAGAEAYSFTHQVK